MGITLSFTCDFDQADRTISNKEYLMNIELQLGSWWVIHYDGHSGTFSLLSCVDKADALALRKRLYIKYFRHQDWVKVIKF